MHYLPDCNVGKFSNNGRCVLCPSGWFNPTQGQLKCTPCDAQDATFCALPGATVAPSAAALTAAPPNAYDRLLDYASLPAVAVVTDIDMTNTTIGVESLHSDIKMMLYSVFASLAVTVVFAHRLYPDACKRADLLFAGDHFIDDSVRP